MLNPETNEELTEDQKKLENCMGKIFSVLSDAVLPLDDVFRVLSSCFYHILTTECESIDEACAIVLDHAAKILIEVSNLSSNDETSENNNKKTH